MEGLGEVGLAGEDVGLAPEALAEGVAATGEDEVVDTAKGEDVHSTSGGPEKQKVVRLKK